MWPHLLYSIKRCEIRDIREGMRKNEKDIRHFPLSVRHQSTSFRLLEILDVLVTWFQYSYILHTISACSNFRHKSWWRLKVYEIHIHIQHSYYETTILQTILCLSLCCWMFVMLSPFRKRITVVEDFQDLVRIQLYQIELGGYSNIFMCTTVFIMKLGLIYRQGRHDKHAKKPRT